MNRKDAIEYFKTVSENHSKAFYCNANEDDLRDFEQESMAYKMAINSLKAWEEILNFVNKQIINRPFRDYESSIECRTYEHIKTFIETKLSEVEE